MRQGRQEGQGRQGGNFNHAMTQINLDALLM